MGRISLNSSKQDLVPLNLERLQHWIDKGLIDPTQPITMRELYETRCVHGVHDGVKILGDVSFSPRFETPPRFVELQRLTRSFRL